MCELKGIKIMKIIFMLNLAYTPNTKRSFYTAHITAYEIYKNIKFNHGMESINNNFRMKRAEKK